MEDTLDVNTSLTTTETNKLPPISPKLLKTVKSITSRLPINNFCLLQMLCAHLKRVSDNEAENRMSISNLALIFIPTLNIGRALFHCMVEYYNQIFEGEQQGGVPAGPAYLSKQSNKGIAITPPPLPQKPRNLSMDTTTITNKKKIAHTKTMSDTHVILNKPRVPPPKPSRSPLTPNSKQTVENTGHSNPILTRPRVPVKPRSKSLSSPAHKSIIHNSSSSNQDDLLWKKSGRVEAIGRQFETLMNKK